MAVAWVPPVTEPGTFSRVSLRAALEEPSWMLCSSVDEGARLGGS